MNIEQQNLEVQQTIKKDNEWKSCCLTVDKNATIYFSQLAISIITIAFCIVQLTLSKSCERDSLYSGILTLVIGVYLPSPKLIN